MAQITPEVMRAQVVFQGRSNLSTDQYVNTFHFRHDGVVTDDLGPSAAEISERLREFYVEPTTNGGRVGAYLSPYVAREFEIRVYDLGDTSEPRNVAIQGPFTLPPELNGLLPLECAVAVSFYAERNIPRHRGRIFLGPLSAGVIAEQVTGEPPKLLPAIATTFAEAMERLTQIGVGDTWRPAVFSPTDNVARTITGGWVDNDFDTIRNRGPIASSRVVWPAA